MPYQSLTRRARLYKTAILAAAVAGPAISSAAFAQSYSYTNVAAAIANSGVSNANASRAISINKSGQLVGYYTTLTNGITSARNYFTYAAGSSTITPYATYNGTTLGYFSAANNGGQLIGDNGSYLANTTSSASSPGGYYSPTNSFNAISADTTYNGTYSVANDPNHTSQTQTATTDLPYAINSSNVVVGIQNFTSTGSNSALTHGFIYNPTTGTMDIGGRPEAGANSATGFSALYGISNNAYVVGNSSTASANFRGNITDAILGVPSGSSYTFTDLASLISPLATAAGGTYYSSTAMDISPNGQYIVGTYKDVTGTGTFTRSFEVNDTASTAVDLGSLSGSTSTNLLNAVAVNDSGTVVGYGTTSGTTTHGFVYSNGVTSDLNNVDPTTGVVYLAGYGIDDTGDIVGYDNATGASGTSASAFELAATPEPTSLILFTGASGLLLNRRRRDAAILLTQSASC